MRLTLGAIVCMTSGGEKKKSHTHKGDLQAPIETKPSGYAHTAPLTLLPISHLWDFVHKHALDNRFMKYLKVKTTNYAKDYKT